MIVEMSGSTFARNLAFLRKKYCLSLRALGRLTGLSPDTLRLLEQERVPPAVPYDSLRRMCEVFGVPAERLTGEDLNPGKRPCI